MQSGTRERRKPSVPVYGPPPATIRRRIGIATMRGANGSTIGHLIERP